MRYIVAREAGKGRQARLQEGFTAGEPSVHERRHRARVWAAHVIVLLSLTTLAANLRRHAHLLNEKARPSAT